MTDVQTRFTSDDKEVNRALENMQKQMAKLREEAAKGNAESRRHFEAISKAGAEAREQLASVVPNLFSVAGATEFVKKGYEEWREEIRAATQEHKAFTDSIVKDLAKVGNLKAADEFRRAAQGSGFTTRAMKESALSGVLDTAPTLSKEVQKRLMQESAPAAAVGLDAMQTGRVAGAIAGMTGGGRGGEADMAVAAQQMVGGSAAQLADPQFIRSIQALQKGGLGFEEAMGIGVAGLQKSQSTKALFGLAEMAGAQIDKVREHVERGHRLPFTEKELAQNRLADMTPQERIRGLLDDTSLRAAAPDATRMALDEITPEERRAAAERLRASKGLINRQARDLAETASGREVLMAHAAKVQEDNTTEGVAAKNDRVESSFRDLELSFKRDEVGAVGRFMRRREFEIGAWATGSGEGGLAAVDTISGGRSDAQGLAAERQRAIDAQLLQENTGATRDLTAAIRDSFGKGAGPPVKPSDLHLEPGR